MAKIDNETFFKSHMLIILGGIGGIMLTIGLAKLVGIWSMACANIPILLLIVWMRKFMREDNNG